MEYKPNYIINFTFQGEEKTGTIKEIDNGVYKIKGMDAKPYEIKETDIIKICGMTSTTNKSDIEGHGYGRPEYKDAKEWEEWKKAGFK